MDINENNRCFTPRQVNRSTSQVDCQVTGLALDELELASLRGTVQEAALHVNFDTRMGRGNLKVAGPRFSGLQVRTLQMPLAGWWLWPSEIQGGDDHQLASGRCRLISFLRAASVQSMISLCLRGGKSP